MIAFRSDFRRNVYHGSLQFLAGFGSSLEKRSRRNPAGCCVIHGERDRPVRKRIAAMPAFFRSHSSQFAAIHNRLGRCRYGIALLWLLVLACGAAAAQNTTISGTVYDPRGATGLPLPNVLVYASTAAVTPPPSGVQCLTSANQTPTGANVVSYANTAVDGSFTLQNIPENASYTIVIQAGKWQRQFSETVGTSPLTGLQLSMPANHTQGNMP